MMGYYTQYSGGVKGTYSSATKAGFYWCVEETPVQFHHKIQAPILLCPYNFPQSSLFNVPGEYRVFESTALPKYQTSGALEMKLQNTH